MAEAPLSRFGPDPHAFFKAVYKGAAPWGIGGIQPAMRSLIEQFPPVDPALDLGCASGDLAIHLARLGHEVLGVDFVENAIEQANAKREMLPNEVAERLTFQVGNALRPSAFGSFGSVFDSGFLHLLDDEETAGLVEDLSAAIVPGGRVYLHEFAVEFPVDNVSRGRSQRMSSGAGSPRLRAGGYSTSLQRISLTPSPTAAIAACIERV